MIEIANLSKKYGSFTAVNGISFSVKRGEVLGFLGPNGAGKSTAMRMISGFLPPTSGSAKVCGFDVVSESILVRSKIGYLAENAPLYPEMVVYDFLKFIGSIRGLPPEDLNSAIDKVVESCMLAEVFYNKIETLSKGFRRRLGLAQAIIHDPEILILDEPTDGLDPNQKHHVRGLIQKMAPEKAILLSTHILEEVEAVCNRAIIIHAGSIQVDSTPSELKKMDRDGHKLEKVFRDLTAGKLS